ncbi:protein YgfX [Xenorhabdus beddingii]|uniref:protein YgfX n=1 Tax=Xenorhabdus beddingii TaxID=40578 RepID=UPI001FCA1455|nr:protein YgfX [Xenorhabdus beddingii]
MVLWNSKLKISRLTCRFSIGVHSGVAVAALLAPWPADTLFFWLPLLAIIMISGIWSQENIRRCRGRLVLFKGNKVHWQTAAWSITQPPWLSRYGMIVILHAFGRAENESHQPPIRLWVASDSVSPEAWRHLNQLMRQYSDS